MISDLIAHIDILDETPPGGRRVHLDFDHLSASRITSLTRCGAADNFKRNWKMPEPESSETIKGNAFHDAGGTFYLQRRAGASAADALEAARVAAIDSIRRALTYDPVAKKVTKKTVDYGYRWYNGPRDTPKTMRDDVLAAVERVFVLPEMLDLDVRLVERGFIIYWRDPNVWPVVGYADVVFLAGQIAGILDYKTSRKIKGDYALSVDPAQVVYGICAAYELGRPIDELRYGSLAFKKALEPGQPASIEFEIQTRPFDPSRLARLFARARQATSDIVQANWRLADSDYTCPECPFRFACSATYGTHDSAILDSASHKVALATAHSAAEAEETPEEQTFKSGPSGKQRKWINDMLGDADLSLSDACREAGFSPVASFDALSKSQGSQLIDTLKPISARAVDDRNRARAIDRQITQARTAVLALSSEQRAQILSRNGVANEDEIASMDVAADILRDAAQTYLVPSANAA